MWWCLSLLLFTCACEAALSARELAVVINENDATSIEIGEYYATKRKIPQENIIRVKLPSARPVIGRSIFDRAFAGVKAATPPHVQAYALTWTLPYRVDCMSITAAFTFGFAQRYCAKPCFATAPSPYFKSDSTSPYRDFGMRLTMAVAAQNTESARFLVDRGIQSDGTHPIAKAYLLVTDDKRRNARAPMFAVTRQQLGHKYPIAIINSNGLRDTFDIMFYFTGIRRVPHLESLGFLPGAIADHLTSVGGKLDGKKQMNVLRWLEAGATGSYGTVVEPCNFPQKFPDPAVAIAHYISGDTLIEAYWKSVVWPGQGLFVGEPLARPYAETMPAETPTN